MYKIVHAEGDTLYKVTDQVEKAIKKLKSEGWVEQGGVSVSKMKYGYTAFYTVAQAMVKK